MPFAIGFAMPSAIGLPSGLPSEPHFARAPAFPAADFVSR
jgi:hypothetical protein